MVLFLRRKRELTTDVLVERTLNEGKHVIERI